MVNNAASFEDGQNYFFHHPTRRDLAVCGNAEFYRGFCDAEWKHEHKSAVDPAVLEHVRKQTGQCRGNQCSDNPLDCV